MQHIRRPLNFNQNASPTTLSTNGSRTVRKPIDRRQFDVTFEIQRMVAHHTILFESAIRIECQYHLFANMRKQRKYAIV